MKQNFEKNIFLQILKNKICSLSLSQNNILYSFQAKSMFLAAVFSFFLHHITIGQNTPPCDTKVAGINWTQNGCVITVSGPTPPDASLNFLVVQEGDCTKFLKVTDNSLTCDLSFLKPFTPNVTIVHSVTLPSGGNPSGSAFQCKQKITLNSLQMTISLVNTQINGNVATINFQVCMNQGGVVGQNSQIMFMPIMPTGLTLLNAGSFMNGQATIPANTMTPGSCQNLTMQVRTASSSFNCADYQISLNPMAGCTNFNYNQGTDPISVGIPPNPKAYTVTDDYLSNYYDYGTHNWIFGTKDLIFGGNIIADIDDQKANLPATTLFEGYNITMLPGSQIIVPTESGIVLDQTHIHGCGAMWNGITAVDYTGTSMGHSIQLINKSILEDAEVGISYAYRTSVFFQNSTFLHNNIAVSVGAGGLSPAAEGSTVNGGILIDGRQASTGLRCIDVDRVHFGLNGSTENVFKNLNYGIYAENVDWVTCNIDRFEDMIPDANGDSGTGIYFVGNGIRYAWTLPKKLNFERCKTGIYGFGGNHTSSVYRAYMDDVEDGVFFINGQPHIVSRSEIRSTGIGVYISNSTSGIDAVQNNTFDAVKGIGVYLDGNFQTEAIIKENAINIIGKSGTGLLTENVQSKIVANKFSLSNRYQSGAFIDGGVTQTSDNFFKGFGTIDNQGLGILMAKNSLCQDTFTNTKIGLAYYGACPGSMKEELFNEHQNGLFMNAQAILGAQGSDVLQHANQWKKGTFGKGLGAYHEGVANQAVLSLFKVNDAINSNYLPTNNGGVNWFIPSKANNKDACVSLPTNIVSEPPPFVDNCEFITKILSEDPKASGDERLRVNLSLTRRAIYRTLYEGFDCKDKILTHFFDESKNNNIGKWYLIDRGLADAQSTPYDDVLKSDEAESEKKHTEIEVIEQEMNVQLKKEKQVEEDLLAKYQAAMESLSDLLKVQKEHNVTAESVRKNKIIALKDLNASIDATYLDEFNEKTANEIYFGIFLNEIKTLSEEQESFLYHTAYQCPLEGGNGVFKARAILNQFKGPVDYNSKALCGYENFIPTKQQQTSTLTTLSVYPNPAKEEITVFLPAIKVVNVTFELFDNLGRSVQIAHLDSTFSTISLRNVNNGIYYYNVRNDVGEIIAQSKIIVQK
jgi:Secretion system C-terminal sorting domain